MKSTIFMPKTIKVGYQQRQDTYTGKLAYVIYYDEKGKLRKEKSWSNWIDNKLETHEFENEPTSGFVLNKKVGDYDSGWNHRRGYCRVYDPRGFEFEITFENLLYILENADSIRGKGLVGEFVYGWDNTDLVLIPIESPDYKQLSEYSAKIQSNSTLKAKDLVVGRTYLTKKKRNLVYLGKFPYYGLMYECTNMSTGEVTYKGYTSILEEDEKNKGIQFKVKYKSVNKGSRFFFCDVTENCCYIENMASVSGKFLECIQDTCRQDIDKLMNELRKSLSYNPLAEPVIVAYTKEQFYKVLKATNYYCRFLSDNGYTYRLEKGNKDGTLVNVKADCSIYFEHMYDCSDIIEDFKKRFGSKVEKDKGYYYSYYNGGDAILRRYKAKGVTIDEFFEAVHPSYANINFIDGSPYTSEEKHIKD